MFQTFYSMSMDPFPKDLEAKHQFKSQDFLQALRGWSFSKKAVGSAC